MLKIELAFFFMFPSEFALSGVNRTAVVNYITVLILAYKSMYEMVLHKNIAKKGNEFKLVEKTISLIHTWLYLLTMDINISIAYYTVDLGIKVLINFDWQMVAHHILTFMALLQPNNSSDYPNIIRYFIYMKLGDMFIYIPKILQYSNYKYSTGLYNLSWYATAITWFVFRVIISFTLYPTTFTMWCVYPILQCINLYWMYKITQAIKYYIQDP